MADEKLNRPTLEIELDPPYSGWRAVCDADPPFSLWGALESGTAARMAEALLSIVVSWNFAGKDGAPVPVNKAGFDRLSTHVVRGFIRAYTGAFYALPNDFTASWSPISSTHDGQLASARGRPRRSTT